MIASGVSLDSDLTLPRLQPVQRRKRAFALTPLADVMFQLLLFFMLTSVLAPYALRPLGAPLDSTSGAEPATTAPAAAANTTIWHLARDAVRAGDTRIALDEVPVALVRMRADGLGSLVGFVTATARAEDLARLIEAVRSSRIAQLQLIGG